MLFASICAFVLLGITELGPQWTLKSNKETIFHNERSDGEVGIPHNGESNQPNSFICDPGRPKDTQMKSKSNIKLALLQKLQLRF